MEAKIVFVKVDSSKLYIDKRGLVYQEDPNYIEVIFTYLRFTPICPILVVKEEVNKGDEFILTPFDGLCTEVHKAESEGVAESEVRLKVLTKDIKEIWPYILNGKIKNGEWHDFSEVITSIDPSKSELYRPLTLELTGEDLDEMLRYNSLTPYEKSLEGDTMEEIRGRIEGYKKEGYPTDPGTMKWPEGVGLPSFLYYDRGEVRIGAHPDSVVTDEWNEWLKNYINKQK